MVNITKFGEEYLLLALRIGKHIKGYVDFYIGPRILQDRVNIEGLASPNRLLTDCKNLQNNLFVQGYDKNRERYLEKILIAMSTTIGTLIHTNIPIEEQFLRLYDVVLHPVNEVELENLKEEVDEAYKGQGSLEERFERLRLKRKVPKDKVFTFFKRALNITENRTEELFIDLLPKNQQISLELTKDEREDNIKWTCYEWYLGKCRSRLVVNPKFDLYWTNLLTLCAHEGYPGHHTEFSLKELKLYHDLNQFEHSVLLINSPKLIISEGIADLAVNVLFSYRDQVEIGLNEFSLDLFNDDPLEVMIAQYRLKHKVSSFWYNFAYHALIDNYTDEELISYGKYYEIFSENTLRNQIKRLNDPVYSVNSFTYNLGMNIIKKRYGEFPSAKNFRTLLINPILPSDL